MSIGETASKPGASAREPLCRCDGRHFGHGFRQDRPPAGTCRSPGSKLELGLHVGQPHTDPLDDRSRHREGGYVDISRPGSGRPPDAFPDRIIPSGGIRQETPDREVPDGPRHGKLGGDGRGRGGKRAQPALPHFVDLAAAGTDEHGRLVPPGQRKPAVGTKQRDQINWKRARGIPPSRPPGT